MPIQTLSHCTVNRSVPAQSTSDRTRTARTPTALSRASDLTDTPTRTLSTHQHRAVIAMVYSSLPTKGMGSVGRACEVRTSRPCPGDEQDRGTKLSAIEQRTLLDTCMGSLYMPRAVNCHTETKRYTRSIACRSRWLRPMDVNMHRHSK